MEQKWKPLTIPYFPLCSGNGFILAGGGLHFLDPLGGLGLMQ